MLCNNQTVSFILPWTQILLPLVGGLCLSLDHNLYHLMLPDHEAWTTVTLLQSRLAPPVHGVGLRSLSGSVLQSSVLTGQSMPAHPVVHQHACIAFVMHNYYSILPGIGVHYTCT